MRDDFPPRFGEHRPSGRGQDGLTDAPPPSPPHSSCGPASASQDVSKRGGSDRFLARRGMPQARIRAASIEFTTTDEGAPHALITLWPHPFARHRVKADSSSVPFRSAPSLTHFAPCPPLIPPSKNIARRADSRRSVPLGPGPDANSWPSLIVRIPSGIIPHRRREVDPPADDANDPRTRRLHRSPRSVAGRGEVPGPLR
jgi:hypothetical protein